MRKSLVKALSASFREELRNIFDIFVASEAGSADGDHRSEHGEASGESACKLVPVLNHPAIQRFNALRMGSKTTNREINILFFDVAAEGESKSSLDEFGILSAAEGPEGGIALVAVLGVEVRIENDIVL